MDYIAGSYKAALSSLSLINSINLSLPFGPGWQVKGQGYKVEGQKNMK